MKTRVNQFFAWHIATIDHVSQLDELMTLENKLGRLDFGAIQSIPRQQVIEDNCMLFIHKGALCSGKLAQPFVDNFQRLLGFDEAVSRLAGTWKGDLTEDLAMEERYVKCQLVPGDALKLTTLEEWKEVQKFLWHHGRILSCTPEDVLEQEHQFLLVDPDWDICGSNNGFNVLDEKIFKGYVTGNIVRNPIDALHTLEAFRDHMNKRNSARGGLAGLAGLLAARM